MKRVLVLTGADETMKDVLNLTVPSKLKYANKWGYDFLTLNSFKQYPQYFEGSHIGFSRFIFAMELLNHYDYVMWLDGDSLVTNDSYSIDDFVNSEHIFFASFDWWVKPEDPIYFSTGNFIVRSTENDNFLLNKFLELSKDHNSSMQEQGTLNYMFSLPEFANYFKVLETKYLGSVPNFVVECEIWRDRSSITHPWCENSFLAHVAGIPNKDRIDIIKNNFEKFII